MDTLTKKAVGSLLLLFFVMAALLFLPAGTIRYWQAWAYLAVFFGASFLITLYLAKNDRALLKRRLSGGPWAEKEPAQKIIMVFTSIGFIALMVVPALDFRFGWSTVPLPLVVTGDVLVVVGYIIIFLVYKENTFTSATIEVAKDQKAISTGPYALVRHPMYAGGMLYLLGTPLALVSWWGLVPFVAMMPFLIWRLFDEEEFLTRNLTGYTEYRNKVRFRLVPEVW
jgi:protein-S-isoprenylcysteine O-methyltransferase Ste14